jgi:hypothetical protein
MEVIDHRKEKLSKIVKLEKNLDMAAQYAPRLVKRLGVGSKHAFPSCYSFDATYGYFVAKDGSKLPGARVHIHHNLLDLSVVENWGLSYIDEILDPKSRALNDLVKRMANSFRAGATRVS